MYIKKRGVMLIVLVLFLVLLGSLAWGGCYYYPKSDEVCSDLTKDVAKADFDSLDEEGIVSLEEELEDFFDSDNSCNEAEHEDKCQEGYCLEIGEVGYKIECEEGKGLKFITGDQYLTTYGESGCCTYELGDTQQCGWYEGGYADCYDFVSDFTGAITKWNPMSEAECVGSGGECGQEVVLGKLSGTVSDEDGLVAGATVSAGGKSVTTFAEGTYELLDLSGVVVLTVTAEGYAPVSETISVLGDKEVNIVLKKVGILFVSGKVVNADDDTKGIAQAQVTVINKETKQSNSKISSADGSFSISGLFPGTYTLKAVKDGYAVNEKDIVVEKGINLQNQVLKLTKEIFQGIHGTVIDKDSGAVILGAEIYIEGELKGKVSFSDHQYKISPLDPGDYKVEAKYESAYINYYSSEEIVTVEEGEKTLQDFTLTKKVGECGQDSEKGYAEAISFNVEAIPGEKKAKVSWEKPCEEATSYVLKRDGTEIATPGNEEQYFDDQVEWGETYDYSIIVNYLINGVSGFSKETFFKGFVMGDEQCGNNVFHEVGGKLVSDEFCSGNEEQFARRLYCSDENFITPQEVCPTGDFCGPADTTKHPYTTICKNDEVCSEFDLELGGPFGLFYNIDTCYGPLTVGEGYENFCYYDYSENSVVSECKSCQEIENDCFNYKSEDACTENNCVARECEWVDSAAGLNVDLQPLLEDGGLFSNYLIYPTEGVYVPVQEEIGGGYCVENGYDDDDQCGLCGSQLEAGDSADIYSSLFENYYCTPDVCSSLGRCYATNLKECESCGESGKCVDYQSEVECVSGTKQSLDVGVEGEIIFSEDSCGWGTCYWDGSNCVKDGDDDDVNDCSSFSGNGKKTCNLDNFYPETKLVQDEGVIFISTANSIITFKSEDIISFTQKLTEEVIPNLHGQTCFELLNEEGTVDVPEQCFNTDEKGEVSVNFLEENFFGEKKILGAEFVLRYYSIDEYNNREPAKTTTIWVDLQGPQFLEFQFDHDVKSNTTIEMTLSVLTDEEASCKFRIKRLFPLSPEKIEESEDSEISLDVKSYTTEMTGEKFRINLTCVDLYDNPSEFEEFDFVPNLAKDITLIYPPYAGVIDTSKVKFKVETETSMTCVLKNADTLENIPGGVFKALDSPTNKVHETDEIIVSIGEHSDYLVICKPILLSEQDTKAFFYFKVGIVGPDVVAKYNNIIRPEMEWSDSFKENVDLKLECQNVPPWDECSTSPIYYCLTETGPGYCNPFGGSIYESPLFIEENKKIYYSTLTPAGLEGEVKSGEIFITGAGINLVAPNPYIYNDQKWGFSNVKPFDLKISTSIATKECKFDQFPLFDFESLVAGIKIFQQVDSHKYKKEQFSDPENYPPGLQFGDGESEIVIAVKCLDTEEIISPPEQLFLQYDPTPPVITDAKAIPKLVVIGNSVSLLVDVDDPARCKFDLESAEWESMKGEFNGFEEGILKDELVQDVLLSGQTKQNYVYNVVCQNGAGDLSEPAQINVNVDFSAIGGIEELWPADGELLLADTVDAYALSNVGGTCTFVPNSDVDDPGDFDTTGEGEHRKTFSGLTPGEYNYLFTCLFDTGHNSKEGLKFWWVIDSQGPKISEIEDGEYSCDLGETPKVFVYANETSDNAAMTYEYELYDEDKTLITKGVINEGSFVISTILEDNNSYYFRVRATDELGLIGNWEKSDGFLAIDKDDPICLGDVTKPTLNISTEKSCTDVKVEIKCKDDIGCLNISYNDNFEKEKCSPFYDYKNAVMFNRTKWLCYSAADKNGNSGKGATKIEVPDDDGDGVLDHCDDCNFTAIGTTVNGAGCSVGQLKTDGNFLDTDDDGLPDYWENLYDASGCEFDTELKDTNGNGVNDAQEDYDEDGYTNLEEYENNINPCSFSILDTDGDGIEDYEDVCDDTPAYELSLIVTDPSDQWYGCGPSEIPESSSALDEETGIGEGGDVSPGLDAEVSIVAWTLFIIGWLLVLGGGGYLYYYYNYGPGKGRAAAPVRRVAPTQTRPVMRRPTTAPRRRVARRSITRGRRTLPGFSKDSKTIPHLGSIVSRKGPQVNKLKDLVGKYQEKKEVIKPGLRKEEKNIFDKLESLAKKGEKKDLKKVVSKEEAKDIFADLKNVIKKRKSK